MSSQNFHRTYTFKAGKVGEQGFIVGNINSMIEDTIHIEFDIEKADVENPNTATVKLWNLSKENLAILEKEDCRVELMAGYGGNNALILTGDIVSVTTTVDNADKMTEIEVMDGRVALRDTVLLISINEKIDSKELYLQVAEKMGISIVFADNLNFLSFPDGFSYVGNAKNALHKIASFNNHSFSIQNGVIQITKPKHPINTHGYLLSPSTGLISIPKRVTIGSTKDQDNATKGYEISYFLNGAIGVNDVIELQTKDVSGYFRVVKVQIDGNNSESDWKCSAQIVEIPR